MNNETNLVSEADSAFGINVKNIVDAVGQENDTKKIEANYTPYSPIDIQSKREEVDTTNDMDIIDALQAGWLANAPLVGRVNHPSGTKDDPDFSISNPEIKEHFDSLDPDVQESVLSFNPRNENEYYAVVGRTEDEIGWQKGIYENYGLAGSLLFNTLGGIAQPDIVLGGPLAAASKAARGTQLAMTVSNKLRTPTAKSFGSATATGTEVAAAGVGIEYLRQQTSGVSFEDDYYNMATLGFVLGAGGKKTYDFFASSKHKPKMTEAMNKDIEETKSFLNRPNDAGPAMMKQDLKWSERRLTKEDVKTLPTPGIFGNLNKFSVRGQLYNVQSPRLRSFLKWIAPSKMPLFNADGSVHVQSARTAEDILDTTYKGMYNDIRSASRNAYNNYKKNTDAPLSEYEFGQKVWEARVEDNKLVREHYTEGKLLQAQLDNVKKKLEALQKDVKEEGKINTKEVEALQKQELEFSTQIEVFKQKVPPTSRITDPYLKQANTDLTKYYEKMNSNHQYWNKGKTEDEIDVTESSFYTTRLWDKQAIASLDSKVVVNRIAKAIQNSPTAKALKRIDEAAYKEYVDSAETIADNMVQKIYSSQSLNEMLDLTAVKRGGSGGLATSKYSIARKIDVDETMVKDLLHTNIDDVVEMYHRDMSGKLSLKESLGINTKEELTEEVEEIIKELRDLGYKPKEIKEITDNLKVTIDTIMGTRSIADNPGSTGQTIKRYATKWNNITLGMGFGYTALMEIGPVLALTGVKGLRYLYPSVKRTIDKYRGKETDVEIFNQLKIMGQGMDVYNSRVASRFTDEDINFAHKHTERLLDKGQNAVMHGSGLVGITDAFKDMAGMGYIHNLHTLGRRLNKENKSLSDLVSKSEMSRFARHGLTEADIRRFGKQPVKYSKDGRLEDLNWEGWSLSEKEKLSTAVNRAVKGNVLEPSSLDLPKVMTDPNGLWMPLMLQYMRFPLASTESYLLRGLAEKDKAAVLGAIISTAVLGTLEVGKSELLFRAGMTDEPGYDLSDEEDQKKLAWKLFNYNPYSGVNPTAINLGFGIAGEPQPGTTYNPKDTLGVVAGPTYGRVKGLIDVIQNQVDDPGYISKTEMYQLKMNTPFLGSFPIIKDWWSAYIKENN